jgi:hypothetical protein
VLHAPNSAERAFEHATKQLKRDSVVPRRLTGIVTPHAAAHWLSPFCNAVPQGPAQRLKGVKQSGFGVGLGATVGRGVGGRVGLGLDDAVGVGFGGVVGEGVGEGTIVDVGLGRGVGVGTGLGLRVGALVGLGKTIGVGASVGAGGAVGRGGAATAAAVSQPGRVLFSIAAWVQS